MKKTIFPKAIGNKAKLGAFTPADPVTPARKLRIEKVVALLERSGLSVRFAKHAFDQAGHISASAEQRASDINELAADAEVHGLIATCGGKCSNALLDLLDYQAIVTAQKPIMGFSDVSVLLNAITAMTGLVTFYGPNVLSKLDESDHFMLTSLRRAVPESVRTYPQAEAINEGCIEGRLIGGNLSTFTVSIAGTQFEPQFDNAILFWESGSRDWRLVDQYLSALHIRGVFERINGMIIGRIGEEEGLSPEERSFLLERLKPLGIPILRMPIFGHGPAENPIWPIGGLVRLDAVLKTVTVLETLVC